MPIAYHQLRGATAVVNELLAPGSGAPSSISISNAAAGTYVARISLYIQDTERAEKNNVAATTLYLYRSLAIPQGVTLIFDKPEEISYNNKIYGLYLKIESPYATNQEIDVIVRTE